MYVRLSGLRAPLWSATTNVKTAPQPCVRFPFSAATSTRRILWLPESATNSALASGLMAMLVGSLKCAAPPTLSVHTELRVYRAVCAHHASSVQARTLNPPRRARTQAQRERPGVPNGS